METDTTKVAFYKVRPTCTMKYRPGPIQCVRTCTNCILRRAQQEDTDTENILLLTSYDNLSQRKKLWFSKYHAIQYHVGQIAILKNSLNNKRQTSDQLTLYVVAATRFNDINYLKMVLEYENIPAISLFEKESTTSSLALLESKKSVAITLEMKSCPLVEKRPAEEDERISSVLTLRDFLEPITQCAKQNMDFDVNLVPVIITKDHDKRLSLNTGSVCVQILESYPLQDYLANIRSQYKAGHLVQHLYHDLARSAARMPANIVAFLLLYLDRDEGVTVDDLIDLTDWFRTSALDLGLQFAFTGGTREIVEFALICLQEFIHYDRQCSAYIPINLVALAEYAKLIMPNIAYQGIIARAILTLHNKDEKNQLLTKLSPTNSSEPIRVMKEQLDLLSQDMAERIDDLLPCRRPCVTVESQIDATVHQMEAFYHYFKVEEPKVKQPRGPSWLNEFDTQYDDEYFASRQNDPAFKCWVVLTNRPYRLDRLNLFINAVESLLLN